MLFDKYHIALIIIASAVIIGSLIGLAYVKNQKHKNVILKSIALTVFLLHISIIWVNYLKHGHADAPLNIIFPVFFCNIMMYLLLIVAFIPNKQGKIFRYLATFVAYCGIVGGIITLLYPESYLNSQDMFLWNTMKSLLSHTFLLIGSAYLFVGGYVKIRFSNVLVVLCGLAGCGLVGLILNLAFITLGLPNPNSMYMFKPAIANAPITMGWWLGLFIVLLVVIVSTLWETFSLPLKERWYAKTIVKIKKIFKNKYNNIYK